MTTFATFMPILHCCFGHIKNVPLTKAACSVDIGSGNISDPAPSSRYFDIRGSQECREEAGEEKTMFVGSAAELVEAR